MDTINNILSSSVLSSLLGITGIVIAIITYTLTRKVSKISSQHEYTSLISKDSSNLPQQISVMFDGSLVENVSSSEFIIWNSGNSVIKRDSLDTKEPLRIVANEGTKILRHQIVISNNSINNIELKTDIKYPNCILIDFDFLEKNEGARIEILHTGVKNDITERGKLIGVKSKFSKKEKNNTKKLKNKNINVNKIINLSVDITAVIFLILIFIFFVYSFISPEVFQTLRPDERVSKGPWLDRIFFILIFITFGFQFVKNRSPYPSGLKKKDN